MSEDRKHAILGGSNAHIWTNCSLSVELSKDLPPIKVTPAMSKGTYAHSIAEKALEDFLHYKETGELRESFIPKTRDDKKINTQVKNYIKTIWEEVLLESITGKDYIIEGKFGLTPDAFGYVDAMFYWTDDHGKHVLGVYDYKDGVTDVAIKDNAQIAFYAVCARHELRQQGIKIDYADVGIYQPNKPDEEGNIFKRAIITGKQLDAWEKKFKKAIEEIIVKKNYKAKLGTWCNYCKAKGKCSAYQTQLSKESTLQLSKYSDEDITIPDVATLSDDNIRRIAINAKAIIAFVEEVKKIAFNRTFNTEKPVKGLKVVQYRQGSRYFPDEDIAVETLTQYGIDKEELYNVKFKGVTDIEAQLKLITKDAKKIIDGIVDRAEPVYQLAHEEDPRTAVVNNSKELLGKYADDDSDDE